MQFIVKAYLKHFGVNREMIEADNKEAAEKQYRDGLKGRWEIEGISVFGVEEWNKRQEESKRMYAEAERLERKNRKQEEQED